MRKITLTLAIAIAGGVAQADPVPFSAWQTAADDTVTCTAIGCQEGDYQRYPEYAPRYGSDSGYQGTDPRLSYPQNEVIEESEPFDPTNEILRRLKDEPLEPITRVEPRPVPESEGAARDEFYQALRQHADGAGTIEQVEAAYQHLIPYRR